MMYIDNEVLEKMIMTIVEGFDRIEKKLDRMGRVKEFLNGDELLDNYDVKTHVDDMGMDVDVSVWQSTTMGDWGYDQAYGSGLFTFPGYYTIKNNKFGYYSIEKVSN